MTLQPLTLVFSERCNKAHLLLLITGYFVWIGDKICCCIFSKNKRTRIFLLNWVFLAGSLLIIFARHSLQVIPVRMAAFLFLVVLQRKFSLLWWYNWSTVLYFHTTLVLSLMLFSFSCGSQDFSQTPPCQELIARDLHDIEWKFRHIFRGKLRRILSLLCVDLHCVKCIGLLSNSWWLFKFAHLDMCCHLAMF